MPEGEDDPIRDHHALCYCLDMITTGVREDSARGREEKLVGGKRSWVVKMKEKSKTAPF